VTAALPAVGNRERIGAWADFVFARRGGVTHVLPFNAPLYGTRSGGAVLCGRMPAVFDEWLGTGSQTEIDQARRMPLCIRCMERSEGRAR
jgi:hypothetical protein